MPGVKTRYIEIERKNYLNWRTIVGIVGLFLFISSVMFCFVDSITDYDNYTERVRNIPIGHLIYVLVGMVVTPAIAFGGIGFGLTEPDTWTERHYIKEEG